jgi:hypothetical protein
MIPYTIVFQGGDDGRGYRNEYKNTPGANLNKVRWNLESAPSFEFDLRGILRTFL